VGHFIVGHFIGRLFLIGGALLDRSDVAPKCITNYSTNLNPGGMNDQLQSQHNFCW
jgi:hypothetical protein